MVRYGRKQYSLKQYGRYQSTGDVAQFIDYGEFRRARIALVLNDGFKVWVYQHSPVSYRGNHNKLRIKTNTKDTIYGQQVELKGKHKIRIKSNLSKDIKTDIISETIIR